MSSSIKYSVIIPAYNSQNTIRACLESLINLNCSNLEIIVVDDESTDNTGNICKEYARKNLFIKYVKIKNHGASNARNVGLSIAKGTWVTFVDSDDYVISDGFKRAIEVLNSDIDMLICNYLKTGEITEFSEDIFFIKSESFIYAMLDYPNSSNICEKYNINIRSMLFSPVWGKFYRRDIIENNDIRFDINLILSEDLLFNLYYLEKCKNIKFWDIPIYSYYVNPCSVSHNISDQKIINRLYFINKLYDYKSNNGYIKKKCNKHIVLIILETATIMSSIKSKDIYYKLKELILSDNIQTLLKDISNEKLSYGILQNKYYRLLLFLLRNKCVYFSGILGKIYSSIKNI